MSYEINTNKAPAAIGPYVQGVDLGNMVITSGQIPVNPETGDVAEDIAAQARQSLENVKAIVERAGLTVGDIVKTTVFVKDLNDFGTVNATYEAFFKE
ncbi:Rid family detoxifying hydrolase, partial [Enterobacter hormaechei]|nr:Rid family detoxifying hydrolase [Enterobacter hormaechei]